MSDSAYILLGFGAFLGACAVHYAGWNRFLGGRLKADDLNARTTALKRWGLFAVAWQVLVVLLAIAWVLPFTSRHAHGFAWAAPAVGLVIGTALPLQLVMLGITRAGR